MTFKVITDHGATVAYEGDDEVACVEAFLATAHAAARRAYPLNDAVAVYFHNARHAVTPDRPLIEAKCGKGLLAVAYGIDCALISRVTGMVFTTLQ